MGSAPGSQMPSDFQPDLPRDAEVIQLSDILPGDVFVLGTDGLFDNAFVENITALIRDSQRSSNGTIESGKSLAETAAKNIATQAAEWASDVSRVSPFALQSSKEGYALPGGKVDDITVLVSVVA